jgi:hypothetical protein
VAELDGLLFSDQMEQRRLDLLPRETRDWIAGSLGEPVSFEAAAEGSAALAGVVRTRGGTFFLKPPFTGCAGVGVGRQLQPAV